MTHLHLADAVFLSDLFSYTNETVIKANINFIVHKEHTNNIYYILSCTTKPSENKQD